MCVSVRVGVCACERETVCVSVCTSRWGEGGGEGKG